MKVIDVLLKDSLQWGFYNSDVAMTFSNSVLILSKSSNGHLKYLSDFEFYEY